MFQETHLNENILDPEIKINRYTAYRSDRKDRGGGGVITYVRSDLVVKSVLKHSNSYCDSLGLYLPELSLALLNVYRPPGCETDKFKETMDEMKTFIEAIETDKNSTPTPTIICGGDFNLGMLGAWKSEDIEAFKSSVTKRTKVDKDKEQAVILVDFAETFFMEQVVKAGTRFNNILDIILCSDPNLIISCEIIVNKQLSDHNTIKPKLSYHLKELENAKNVNHAATNIPEFDIASGDEEDWMRMNSLIQTEDLKEKMQNKTVTQMTNILLETLATNVAKVFKKKETFKDHKKKQHKEHPKEKDIENKCDNCEYEIVHQCTQRNHEQEKHELENKCEDCDNEIVHQCTFRKHEQNKHELQTNVKTVKTKLYTSVV